MYLWLYSLCTVARIFIDGCRLQIKTYRTNRYGQARSQDLEKGGAIWKSEKCANDLDSNFHWPWISFRRFVRNLRRNVSERSEIQRFFPPKIRWSPKKKKVFAKIQSDFSAKIQHSNVFFRPKLGDLQKQKKKKRSSPKFRVIFRPKSKIQTFFRPKLGDLQKRKKKKKVFAKIQGDFSPNFASSNVWGGLFSYGGGYFPFFTENRHQNHKKHAILHTSQANGGGGSSPPRPPPGYATGYGTLKPWVPMYPANAP